MTPRQSRDPLWYRLGRFTLPWWAVWLIGMVVLVPAGFVIGGIGIAGDLSDHQWQWQIVYAIALGLAWTGLCLFTRRDND